MILIWKPFILIILLILSIFFETFWKVLFSRYLPPTTTNVQKVWSIMTFSLSVVDFPPIKSNFDILSLSCCVWVKGSKRVTSSSRVILHTMSWYVNYLFEIWLKILEISMKFMKISRWLSLSEWLESSCWHRNWWTNNVVFLYPGPPAARRQCHGSLEIFLYPSSFLLVFRITNQRNNQPELLQWHGRLLMFC